MFFLVLFLERLASSSSFTWHQVSILIPVHSLSRTHTHSVSLSHTNTRTHIHTPTPASQFRGNGARSVGLPCMQVWASAWQCCRCLCSESLMPQTKSGCLRSCIFSTITKIFPFRRFKIPLHLKATRHEYESKMSIVPLFHSNYARSKYTHFFS